MTRNPAIEDWIDRARAADIWAVLGQVAPGHRLKLRAGKAAGPCPGCGGTDRFSVDRHKRVFNCRKGEGGDAIAMVSHITGADFFGAIEIITGEAPPDGSATIKQDAELLARRRLEQRQDAERAAAEAQDYRLKEINRAAAIWQEAKPFDGTSVAERYLALRGLKAPAGARLRCHGDLAFWHWSSADKAFRKLFSGPAMVARIDDGLHRLQGVHCTWIDLARPKGKVEAVDPESGEILPAKKMRGSKKGGHIHLGGNPKAAIDLKIGEGIETVLSVREALLAAQRPIDEVLFWTSCDLSNMGGPAVQSVAHPTLKRADSRGRERALKVPGPVPAWPEGEAVLMPPDQVREVTLLGDGDSDHFSTEQHLKRAAARWASADRVIKAAWAAGGADFNDIWRRETA